MSIHRDDAGGFSCSALECLVKNMVMDSGSRRNGCRKWWIYDFIFTAWNLLDY
jgi:hypothetical protein